MELGDIMPRYWVVEDDEFVFVLEGERPYMARIPKDQVEGIEKRSIRVKNMAAVEYTLKLKDGRKIIVRPERWGEEEQWPY